MDKRRELWYNLYSHNTTFDYNGMGQRTGKHYQYDSTVGSTNDLSYTYDTEYNYDDAGRLMREVCTEQYSNGSTFIIELIYLYNESGMIGVRMRVNGEEFTDYFYRRNALGDVIAIYNTSYTRVVEYAYDAWGNCTTLIGATTAIGQINPIRYRGYYYDRETGLYFCNSRYYNPEWRRFISPDSINYIYPESVNGLNLYCYCLNNPIMYSDKSGHLPEWLGWIIAGVSIALSITITIASFGSLSGVALGAMAITGLVLGGVSGALNAISTGGNVFIGAITGALVGMAGSFNPIAGGLMAFGTTLISDRINNSKFTYFSLTKAFVSGITAFVFAKGSSQLADAILSAGSDSLLVFTAYGLSNGIFSSYNYAADTIISHIRRRWLLDEN